MANGERVYSVPPVVFAPTIISVVALVSGLATTRWALLSLPFIWLGAICSAPNMNCANGCLAYLAILSGLVVSVFCKPVGLSIFAGAAAGFYGGVLEQNLRMRPADDDD